MGANDILEHISDDAPVDYFVTPELRGGWVACRIFVDENTAGISAVSAWTARQASRRRSCHES